MEELESGEQGDVNKILRAKVSVLLDWKTIQHSLAKLNPVMLCEPAFCSQECFLQRNVYMYTERNVQQHSQNHRSEQEETRTSNIHAQENMYICSYFMQCGLTGENRCVISYNILFKQQNCSYILTIHIRTTQAKPLEMCTHASMKRLLLLNMEGL